MSKKNHSDMSASAQFNPFSTATLALQRKPPALLARMVTLAICCMAIVAIIYAYLAKMDIVVTAQGRVIPSGKSKVIQPLEAGIVKIIAVKDGQKVNAGDILVELDPTTTGADRDRLQRELWEAEVDTERLNAMLAGQNSFKPSLELPQDIIANGQAMLLNRQNEQRSKLAALDADIARRRADHEAINANITQIRNSLPLVRKKHEMREDLAKTGHIAETGVIETKLELINLEKELNVQTNRLQESAASLNASTQLRSQAVAEFRSRASSELAEISKKRDAAKQELIKANQRRDLQVLKAPIDGIVQQMAVTTVGGVVTQAQALMTVVPENTPLEVEAQVLNRDIGHVKVGQRVINKVETFDFTRYGYLEGEVLWVGTDAVVDQKLGPVYPVRIKLGGRETPNIVNGRKGSVTAGMNITADIKTDQRRMIEYFLAPMLRYKEESLRER